MACVANWCSRDCVERQPPRSTPPAENFSDAHGAGSRRRGEVSVSRTGGTTGLRCQTGQNHLSVGGTDSGLRGDDGERPELGIRTRCPGTSWLGGACSLLRRPGRSGRGHPGRPDNQCRRGRCRAARGQRRRRAGTACAAGRRPVGIHRGPAHQGRARVDAVARQPARLRSGSLRRRRPNDWSAPAALLGLGMTISLDEPARRGRRWRRSPPSRPRPRRRRGLEEPGRGRVRLVDRRARRTPAERQGAGATWAQPGVARAGGYGRRPAPRWPGRPRWPR